MLLSLAFTAAACVLSRVTVHPQQQQHPEVCTEATAQLGWLASQGGCFTSSLKLKGEQQKSRHIVLTYPHVLRHMEDV